MHWPANCLLLLVIIKLSYQQRCPFSGGELHALATNAISEDEAGGELRPYLDKLENSRNLIKPKPGEDLFHTQNLLPENGQNYRPSDDNRYDELTLNSFIQRSVRLECAFPPKTCANETLAYRSFDGSCNNLAYPGYGMANSRYSRILNPKYSDGKYLPPKSSSGEALPNAHLLSLSLYGDETYLDSFRTVLTMQWGQFVAHDISDFMSHARLGDCCENPNHKLCYSIPLHAQGPITLSTGKTCMSFARGLSDADISCPKSDLPYAEKISKTTPYMDLSSLYGNSLEYSLKTRTYQGGLLKTVWYNHQQFLPITPNVNGECRSKVDHCYDIPDKRNQFTPTIAVIHTILVREHNRLATELAQLNPLYTDEKLFQLARKINIAQYQKISYYDWLPLLLGGMHSYSSGLIYDVEPRDHVNDYDESSDPAALAENAGAAFRYAHNQIPGWFSLVSSDRLHNKTLRLSNYFQRQGILDMVQMDGNFDALVRGLITQLQKRADDNMDKEIKYYLGRNVLHEFGMDLKAIDIQRGRDFGLASYNDYREYCGLPRAYKWSDFATEISQEKISLMQKFYASPDDVDLNVGGSLEGHSPEAIFGPTFQCIMTSQFLTTRVSDRFFFEHDDAHSGFTPEQLAEIRKVTLAGLFCANTINLKCIQSNVFVFPDDENVLVPCKSIPQLNLKLWQNRKGY
ncbi:peroxidase isoform X1 [Stomoxys calcitrans]|uniref:peroxidase isoform X1 n=1 Tax=Stomoxys calcitrans TaxID=35570 RepID=UPI0027E36E6E|nr:peroxidase isoform X1 [Stomoxys calcitrans]